MLNYLCCDFKIDRLNSIQCKVWNTWLENKFSHSFVAYSECSLHVIFRPISRKINQSQYTVLGGCYDNNQKLQSGCWLSSLSCYKLIYYLILVFGKSKILISIQVKINFWLLFKPICSLFFGFQEILGTSSLPMLCLWEGCGKGF